MSREAMIFSLTKKNQVGSHVASRPVDSEARSLRHDCTQARTCRADRPARHQKARSGSFEDSHTRQAIEVSIAGNKAGSMDLSTGEDNGVGRGELMLATELGRHESGFSVERYNGQRWLKAIT